MCQLYLCGLLLNCSAGAPNKMLLLGGLLVAASSIPPSRILLHALYYYLLLHGHNTNCGIPLLTCVSSLSLAVSVLFCCVCTCDNS